MTAYSEKRAYWQVLAFAFAAFVFNTTEFIPVALLSDIGKSFAMPVANVGLMMTVYAWVVSLLSLPCMLLTAKIERKKLLMILFTIFIFGHIVSVIAWNFGYLLAGRIVVALAHSVFWAITSALVMRVAPKGKKQMALAWLSMGGSLATILGLPIGRTIGQALGWRTTFGVIGLLALVLMVMMARLLPKLPSENAGSLHSLPMLAKRPLLVALYALTVLSVTAHFTAYSYIEPFMRQIAHLSDSTTTLILLVFGASGLFASWLFGRLHKLYPNTFLWTSALILLASLLSVHLVSQSQTALFIQIFLWGTGMAGLYLCLIMRVLNYAPDATDVATAIYSGIFNIGIGGGALLGGVVMQRYGLHYVGYVGAAFAIVGMMIFAYVQRKHGKVQAAL